MIVSIEQHVNWIGDAIVMHSPKGERA